MGRIRGHRQQLGIDASAPMSTIVSYCGIWTQHVWIFWINTNNHALPPAIPWQSLYLVLSLAMIVMGIGCARSTRTRTEGRGHVRDLAAAAGTSLATVAVVVSNTVPGLASLAAAALLIGGIGFAWLYLEWGVFYSRLDLRQAIAFLFIGGIAAAGVKEALALLPAFASGLLAATTPVLSVLMCRRALASPPHAPRAAIHFTAQNISALWKAVATFVVFSIANASMLSLQPPSAITETMGVFTGERALELALCACVLLYVFKGRRSFDFNQLWRIVLLLLATDFLVNILYPTSPIQPFFAGVSLNFVVLFVWLVLADVSRHSDLPPALVFGIGWSCYTLPFFLGSCIVGMGGFTRESTGYFAVLMYVVAMVAAFCLEARDQNTKQIFLDLDDEAHAAPEDFTSIDRRCEELGRQRGLTTREVEVMQMLCKGRSKAYIAETLFVTENTVKGHAKRLYTKLDVHSKKELQQLVDAY
jgi:DNA-binding CsgD family transcriptional regulator